MHQRGSFIASGLQKNYNSRLNNEQAVRHECKDWSVRWFVGLILDLLDRVGSEKVLYNEQGNNRASNEVKTLIVTTHNIYNLLQALD